MERIGFKTNFVHSEPQRVYIELTSRCNLNCSICYRRNWQENTGDMDQGMLKRLLSELRTFKTRPEVLLGGIGEPTSYPHFLAAVNELKDFPLVLTSNGTMLHSKEIAAAVASSFNKVVISVDGCDETYYKIRGTSLDSVIRGIELVRSSGQGPEILLQLVLSAENRDSVRDVIDLAADLRVQGVIISNLLPQIPEHCPEILYSHRENKELKEFFNRIRNYSFMRGINITLPAYELKSPRHCRFIESGGVVVNYLGDVTPCYRLAHHGREYVFGRAKDVVRHPFGNLRDGALLAIWNQRDYQRFRHTIYSNLYPSCPDCELVDGCEIVSTTTWDCEGNMPTCGDCLWARNFVICP